MKVLPPLLFAAAITNSYSGIACSYAVREHPILASRAPVATGEGVISVRIAISQVLLPARFAKTQYVFDRPWLGLRGQKFEDGTAVVSSEPFEVTGKIDVVCFYPGDAYEVLPNGRLAVWVSGKMEASNPERLALPIAVTEAERAGSVWRTVRWSMEEDANTALKDLGFKPAFDGSASTAAKELGEYAGLNDLVRVTLKRAVG